MKRVVMFVHFILFSIFIVSCLPHGHGDGDHHGGGRGDHWRAPSESRNWVNPNTGNMASIEMGKSLFEENCVGCHGLEDDPKSERSMGDPMHNIAPHVTYLGGHHSDGEIAWKITNGRGKMPAWGEKLNQKQIWDLVNYLQSI